MVHHLIVCASDIEIEAIGRLPLEGSNERLAVAGTPHHTANLLLLEECVELGHRAVQRLSRGAALKLVLQLESSPPLLGGRLNHGSELPSVEGGVLYSVIVVPVGTAKIQ